MEEIRIDASRENTDIILSALDRQLEKVGCPEKIQYALDVAVEEIFGNICQYAYEGKGEASIRICVLEDMAKITFIDSGKPFNPLERARVDVVELAESDELGGLGILMVKESMDDVSYDYIDGRNHLTIEKRLR